MKTKFNDFINETKNEKSYSDFLNDIIKSLMTDFKYNQLQSSEYIKQYEDLFKELYSKEFDAKEAIAATKVSGVKLDDTKTNESFINLIDDDIDNLTSIIEKIQSKKDLSIAHKMIKNYFNNYSEKTYSDIRIYERIKNNYIKMKKLYNIKYNSFNKK